ncbi:MAG TPA: hypothetical protein PK867_18890, partial [Pirellulales bacterium]|nr:hypothetical protein [Pirellulales bacterium]
VADGFADKDVYVLDPAAGTGSYLVEVAKRIHRTLTEQGHGALAAARVKDALCSRVYGFEVLPAPYIVAHLQLGILLRSLQVPLGSHDRCEVYLTNALTGWEPPKEPKNSLLFPELQRESERASGVKRTKPILVVIGNPPYNRFAGVAEEEEADLIEPYKAGLYETWGIRKQLLDDLYIRFFRLAEKRIAEVGGRGVVSFISNYSWLDGLSHPVMRERLATNFDAVWIDNCNGDKYKTGKRTPDGRPDESMFTTDDHRVGIQVGTAIATFLKTRRATGGDASASQGVTVHYREFWGTGNVKREALLASLNGEGPPQNAYQAFKPRPTMRWVFVPVGDGAASYETWCPLADLFPVHYSGLNENRQGSLMSGDRDALEGRMRRYFDRSVTDEQIAEESPALIQDAARFDGRSTRRELMKAGVVFDDRSILRLGFRPLDDIWVYWVATTKLLNEKRTDFREQVWRGNRFLSASQTGRKGGFNIPTITDKFGDLHLQDPWSQFLPLWVRTSDPLLGESCEPNIDRSVLESLCTTFGIEAFDAGGHATKAAREVAEDVFYHALAVLWSPKYRADNAQALRQDWPRIPLPADRATLSESAKLGRTVAELLLPDEPVRGVTTGKLRPELRSLAVPTKVGGGAIEEGDLKVEAGYGFRGQKNAVMCGKGRVVPSTEHPGALDVYINDRVYWANVPQDVWELTIGGYPVVKKWLSYREHKILGRPLRLEEVTYVTEVGRRLKALLLLGQDLDTNYEAAVRSSALV